MSEGLKVEIKMCAKAFSGEEAREYQMRVEETGCVEVWDEVAGNYTLCHSLSANDRGKAYAKAFGSGEKVWIDACDVSDIGFLVSNTRQGSEPYVTLRDYPARTNQSRQPRLEGWCGTTNDVSCHAKGLARFVRYNSSRTRVLVQLIAPESVAAREYLEAEGYPELIP